MRMTSIVRSDAAAARGIAPDLSGGEEQITDEHRRRVWTASGDLPQQLDVQLRHIFDRLSALGQAAGTSLESAVRATVYLTDLTASRELLDDAFSRAFGDHPPARTTIGVSELPGGALVEIDLIVAVPRT
jgi:enamine deaminase RidA (YjgF/YER057c/UK114 family)